MKVIFKIFLMLALLTISASSTLSAQKSSPEAPVKFEHLTIEDGFPKARSMPFCKINGA